MNLDELVNELEEAARKTAQSSNSYRCSLPGLAGLTERTFAAP
jgi:hypothetical protein